MCWEALKSKLADYLMGLLKSYSVCEEIKGGFLINRDM